MSMVRKPWNSSSCFTIGAVRSSNARSHFFRVSSLSSASRTARCARCTAMCCRAVACCKWESAVLNNSCLASSSFRLRRRNSLSQCRRWSFWSQNCRRITSSLTSSSVGRTLLKNRIKLARNDSIASTEVTWACPAMTSTLVEVFLDALGLSQQVRRVHLGKLDEFLQRFHRQLEFLGKLVVLLILRRVSQGAKTGLQQDHPVFQITVKALQLFREPPHLLRIHDRLCHCISSRFLVVRRIIAHHSVVLPS